MADNDVTVGTAMSCLTTLENELTALCTQLLLAGDEACATCWYLRIRQPRGSTIKTIRNYFDQARDAHSHKRRGEWFRIWSLLGDWERELQNLQSAYQSKFGAAQVERVRRAPQLSAWNLICSIPQEISRAARQLIGSIITSWVHLPMQSFNQRDEQLDPLAEIRSKEDRRCLHCDYNISAHQRIRELEPRCPECGKPFERLPVVIDSYFAGALQAISRARDAAYALAR